MKSRTKLALFSLFICLSLNACGIRPGELESPAPGRDDFPQIYPAEETIVK